MSPLMAVIALMIKAHDGGPIFYIQTRLGRHGEIFDLVKFRTMIEKAESIGGGLRIEENDPRITPAGRWLRRYSLDELPQLFNVLRGDMSIVGPRPALPRDLEKYTPQQRRRLDVKPGITGLAQVEGRASLSWPERIELDLEYIEKRSLLLDIKIMLKTLPRMIQGDEIYSDTPPWDVGG